MADRITKSVRRIVRSMDDDPVGLASADQRKTIGTSRGEAYINSRGDVTSSGNDGGSDIDKQPGSGTPPTDDADDKDTGGSGGKNDGTTPPDAVSGDAADVDDALVLDAKAGPVTGTDPTTANFTSINFDSLAGIEYTPPNGWEGPDSPPEEERPIPDGAIIIPHQTYLDGLGDDSMCLAISIGQAAVTDGFEEMLFHHDDRNPGATPVWADQAVGPACNVFSTGPVVRSVIRRNSNGYNVVDAGGCPSGYTASPDQSVCLLSNPSTVEHPSDGECSVVYDHDEGGYKGHEKDVDCSAAQKTPSTCVIIRSQTQSSRYFRYCRLSAGGTKITEVDSGGVPVPGTITKILDESGRVTDFVDVALDPKYT